MERGEKIVVGVLAVAIIAAVGVFAYYQLPEDDGGCGDTVLTVSYQGDEWTYSLCDLKDLDSTSGQGGMNTKAGISGPWNFTGVSFTTLLADIDVLPTPGLHMNVVAADDWTRSFDMAAITGNVTTYDASGNITEPAATPIPVLAYRQNDSSIGDEDGPLRAAYVAEQPVYTRSGYWVKQVVHIDVEHVVTVSYNGSETTYTRGDLADLETVSGSGGMNTKAGISGPWNFTGVSFATLLQDAGVSDPRGVNMTVTAADGWSMTFDPSAIAGDITTYNASGNITAGGNLTGMIAHRQDGAIIGMEDGPFRVAFVAEQPLYTRSGYWVKQVVYIDIADI